MASLVTIQHSLNAGELSPQMWGRLDLNKYREGTSTCRNFIVNYRGGVMSRPGLHYVGTCLQSGDSPYPPRDIPFQFSNTQGLVLEFGHLHMRVKQNGAYIVEPPVTVSSVNSSGLFTTSTNHGYSVGDWVYNQGNTGFSSLTWIVRTTPALNTFIVTDLFGTVISSATASTTGTIERIYTADSPYADVDLPYLKYTESADVMSLTCVNTDTGTEYPPYDLTRHTNSDWSFDQIAFGATIQPPENVTATAQSSDVYTTWYSYVVTAVDRKTGEESVASTATNIQNNDIGVFLGSNTISWSPVEGASSYNIYKATPAYSSTVPVSSLYGFMTTSLGTSAIDDNITPDFTVVPPQHTDPFALGSITDIIPLESGQNYSQQTVSWSVTTSTGSGFTGYPIITNGGLAGFLTTDSGKLYAPTDIITFSDSGGGVATGYFVSSTNPGNNDTIVVNGTDCNWKASDDNLGMNECYFGPTLAQSIQNMVNALNASTNPNVSLASYTGDDTHIYITYKYPGTIGNSFTIANSDSPFTTGAKTSTLGPTLNIENLDTHAVEGPETIPLFTITAHGFTVGQTVYITGIVGTTFYNDSDWIIYSVPSPNTFTVRGISGTVYGDTDPLIYPWSSGGTVQLVTGGTATTTHLTGGGTIGIGARASLVTGVTSGTYPGAVTYFQQRRVYGASLNQPDTYWMTQTGLFTNMDSSIPVTDSDAITGTPWAQQVNGIQFLVPMPGGLVVFTGRGAWQIGGGNSAAITPSNQDAIPQAYIGCNQFLQPIPVNYDILYCPSKGFYIRDMSYNFFFNIYTSSDITFLSNHLFDGHSIKQWCYAEEPYKLVWLVRDDGVLLCLTYIKEQEVFSWTRHDTNGQIVGVCTVTEPPVDAVYCITKRYIQGNGTTQLPQWKYYSERFDNRLWTNVEDSFCVDGGIGSVIEFPNANIEISLSPCGPS